MSGYSPYPQAAQGSWMPAVDQRSYLQGGPTGFSAAVREGVKNTFNYQGRASQGAYWWFVLFNTIVFSGLYAVGIAVLLATKQPYGFVLAGLYMIAEIFPALSLAVRRLHDSDRSGFWIFISFVPFIGGIWALVLMILDGTPGPNRYDGIQYPQQPAVPYGQQQPAGYQPPAGY